MENNFTKLTKLLLQASLSNREKILFLVNRNHNLDTLIFFNLKVKKRLEKKKKKWFSTEIKTSSHKPSK